MIDDFIYKTKSKRIDLNLISNQEDPIPPIDLTNILRKLSSLYYKTDLLNSIAISINQKVDLEDICLLKKSQINSLVVAPNRELNIFRQTELFYRYGSIQSLYFNRELFELSLLFDTIRQTNNLLYQSELKTIYLRSLTDILDQYFKNDFRESLNFLFAMPSEINAGQFQRDNPLKRMLKNLQDKVISRHSDYLKDSMQLEKLRHVLESPAVHKLNSSQRELIRNYIDPFFESFMNNDFPLVMIREDKEFDILCHYHFSHAGHNNPFFFDFKEVSHHSPILITIGLAISLISPLLVAFHKMLKIEQTYWEKEKAKEEAKALKAQREKQELIEKQLQQLTELTGKYSIGEKIFDANITDEINKIPSDYYKQKLLRISENIQQEYGNLLKNYNFRIQGLRFT